MGKKFKNQRESKRVIKSKAFELLVEGPTRSSKTFTILSKLHVLMSLYPNARGLILRKTKTSMSQSVLQTFEDEILGQSHYLVAGGPRRANRQSYMYKNGSELVCQGMDNKDSIMSAEFDIVYINEGHELTEEDFGAITTRMSCTHLIDPETGKSWRQVLVCTNPQWPQHWLNQRFLKPSPKRERIFVGHKCNPKHFHHVEGNEKLCHWTNAGKDYMENLTESLSGVQKKRLLDGLWAMGDNLVFDEFSQEEHCRDRKDFPDEFDFVYVGVDFGWTAGAAVVIGFRKEIAYVLETHIYSEKQISEWIDILKDIRKRYENIRIVADSAEPRSIEQIRNAGLSINPVKKCKDGIKIGIDLIKTRLNHEGIFFDKNCQKSNCELLKEKRIPAGIFDEFSCYQNDLNTDKPISKYNHAIDSTRYVFLTVDNQPAFDYVISEDDSFDDDDMWS
ncbi:MAG: phage terminase large subunit [Desulfobacterales bacterium]|nr:phage terminase large subunit [Desulfobacterales bacterium]